jgi:hypothetical protein
MDPGPGGAGTLSRRQELGSNPERSVELAESRQDRQRGNAASARIFGGNVLYS